MHKRRISTSLLSVLLATSLGLSACANDANPTNNGDSSDPTTTTSESNEPGDTSEPSDTTTPDETDGTEEPDGTDEPESIPNEAPNYEPEEEVTITYAGWENDLNFAIIRDKFQERHPNIKIERFESNFVDEPELTRLAAAGELPDVISINNIGLSAKNGWLIDLYPLFNADPIAEKSSYMNIVDSLDILGNLYALPTQIFLSGLNMNVTLLEANNVDIPGYDWTTSEVFDVLQATTVAGESLGQMDSRWAWNYLPGTIGDEALGRLYFNGETKQFELDDEWEDTINYFQRMLDAGVSMWEHADKLGLPWELEEGDPERKKQEDARAQFQIDKIGTTEDGWPTGKTALNMFTSYGTGWSLTDQRYTGFDFDFYPYPLGDDKAGNDISVSLVTDLAGISTSATEIDAAYEFLRYLSYETQGYVDRYDGLYNYDREAYIEKYGFSEEVAAGLPEEIEMLYATQGPHMNAIPAANTPAARDAFKAFHPIGSPDATPGLYYQLDYIDNGHVDLHRNQPGFNDAFGYIVGNMESQIINGDKAPADIAQEVQDGANQIIQNWLDDIEAAINTP